MKKLGYRSLPTVTRTSDDHIEQIPALRSDWITEFAASMMKGAVQPRREESIFDQISSVMNSHKPRYSSVEDAVKDMQERSGLTAYHNTLTAAKTTSNVKKNAATAVKVFEMHPQIKSTCDNCIEDSKGNLSIPAILDKVRSIHKNDVFDDTAWDDDGLLKYINTKNTEAKQKHPDFDESATTLGKSQHFEDKDIDPSNTNALFCLTPVVL